MRGVLLVNAPAPSPSAGPPLGALYVAASLQAAGIPVRALDLASRFGPDTDHAVETALAEAPTAIIGFSLYTETALRTYRLLARLKRPANVVRVAGGPHATARPEEALAHGFDVVVRGEGEQTVTELVRALHSGDDLATVPGLAYRGSDGSVRTTAERAPGAELDSLPSPSRAHRVFPRAWYVPAGSSGTLSPSLITSRGCPGRCVFCSSFVSGRRHRFHSTRRVLEELREWHEREGTTSFFFHDDAFTAHRPRLLELCAHITELPFRCQWLCEARVDHLDQERTRAMARAGCTTVIVGIESGSPGVLERIGKGITLDAAESALRCIKDAGLRTQANFMLGFPDETEAELTETLEFMARVAPLVDGFSSMGIVTPFPGTALYADFHRQFAFTDWWLDPERMDPWFEATAAAHQLEATTLEDAIAVHRRLEEAVLAARLIGYSAPVRQAIERCLTFRRAHNLEALRRASTLGR